MNNIIVAVTGASGSIYALRLLNQLQKHRDQAKEVALIFSREGKQVWDYELQEPIPEGFMRYDNDDFFSPAASGSSDFKAMIVCPCSMGTLGRIASGTADTLIARAADVALKERRRLILVVREAPLHLTHIRNMEVVTLAGGIIFPASPAFYHKPNDLTEAVDHTVKRALELAGITTDLKPWKK